MPNLVSTVHVADPDGVSHAFGPGDDVPPWAVKAITNPKAWADEPEAVEPAPSEDVKPKRPSRFHREA